MNKLFGEVKAENLLCPSIAMYCVHFHSSDICIILVACN